MTIPELKETIHIGLAEGWKGGVAVVFDGTTWDAVPGAYLRDVSWSGRHTAMHVVTYHGVDECLEDDDAFARELALYLERAIEYNRP